ncbi:Cysteine-rich receptor-like protein kinase 25 isoform C [Glycine soja]|uniref:Cysteine-rich receptor-like protein kinase 25 isoform B n=1 Tax=Glycine soja TaxID=3848 RepID=A0A445F4R5_GLYSO|nr:Cysteine-rich receptor-like protein kinase 25 isoform B [Glycine soja]RZB43829.1 Cysteine-rich receptor-like protein kinase 25 isoform C [Glycine soja]
MFLSNKHVDVTFLLFLFMFEIGSSSAAPVYNANYCPNNTSYNSNVTFQTNLRVLLASLVSNVSQSDGSYNSAMGMGTTSVASGQFLCRGDVSPATCQDCIASAATEITRLCPNKTESIIWYDECTLRFTNRYFAPTSIDPGARLSDDKNISASDLDSFNQTLFGLLNELVEEAANSQSARKFATGESEFAGSSPERTVYALTECEPSLTIAQCEECLQNAVSTLPSCCGGKQGARALLAWCNVRYELFQFYNTSGSSAPSSGNKKSVARVVLIVVLVVLSIILLCGVCYFILKRSKKKSNTLLRENFGEESDTLESLQFGLPTVEAATKKFSHENRIGEGGFGEVYKGILPDGREIAVKKLSQSSGQEKSDVFSFGVIVLEIISAKRNTRSVFSDHDDLLSYAWEQWRDQTPLNILDQNIKESCNHREVIKCIQIGLLCVQEKPEDRPTMTQVVSYLNNSLVELPFPRKPINSKQNEIVQKMIVGESSSGSALSNNGMSVSVLRQLWNSHHSHSVVQPRKRPLGGMTIACYATQIAQYSRPWNLTLRTFCGFNNATDMDQFNEGLRGIVDGLRSKAASGNSLKKYAAGSAAGPSFQAEFSR